jgi:hypothetical protein
VGRSVRQQPEAHVAAAFILCAKRQSSSASRGASAVQTDGSPGRHRKRLGNRCASSEIALRVSLIIFGARGSGDRRIRTPQGTAHDKPLVAVADQCHGIPPFFDRNLSHALLSVRNKDIRRQFESGTQSSHLRQSEPSSLAARPTFTLPGISASPAKKTRLSLPVPSKGSASLSEQTRVS